MLATGGNLERRPLLMLTMLAGLETFRNPAPADARDAGHLVATSGKATLADAHDADQSGNLSKSGPC